MHPNLQQLSDSSAITLHKCPRRYELDKLNERRASGGDEHTDFGQVVGLGTQELFVHGDIKRAYLTMLSSWKSDLDDEAGVSAKKTFWHALNAIDKFASLTKTVLSNYKVASLNGRPAVELGFSIDCGDGFYYRGFIDSVLVDSFRKKIIIYEGKTTKFSKIHEAVYKNSGQALGYSLVLDRLTHILELETGSSYEVMYCIYKTSSMEWEIMKFLKNHTQRALWIKQLLIDKRHIQEYAEDNYFPMRGESCYDFFRPCPHFDYCTISNSVLFPNTPEVRVEATEKYDFYFNLRELIETQLSREARP